MRLLSLIALGAASVSASPDAVDEILRKLSANSSNDTASSNAGGGGSSNVTASTSAGGGAQGGNTTATAQASASASAAASANTTVAPVVTTVAPVVTTVAASANATTVAASANATTAAPTTVAAGTTAKTETTTVATNATTGNSTANSTAAEVPERSIDSSSEVTMTVPAEISDNTTLMEKFEDMLGNSFGDVVCDSISGDAMPFATVEACKCGTKRNPAGYTYSGTDAAKPAHQCKASKTNRRRAEATRRLSSAVFKTESKVKTKVTDAQKALVKTKLEISPSDMKSKMNDKLTVRANADDAPSVIKGMAANLTVSAMAKMTSATTEVATTTAATAGAVAAASTGLGLLIAALLF